MNNDNNNNVNNGNCLLRFDALGTIVGFRIDGHNRKRSTTGAIMTIILIIISISVLGFFGEVYINKKETYQKNLIHTFDQGQTLDLSKRDFIYAIKYDDREIQLYKDSYELEVSWVIYDLSEKKLIKKVKLRSIKCDNEKWVGTEKQFDLLKIGDANCYDNHEIKLYGNSHYGEISRIEYKIVIKDNVVNDPKIIDKLAIMELTNPSFIYFYFYNPMFSSDEGHARDHYIDKYAYEVNIDITLKINIFLSMDKMIQVNDGLVVNSETELSEYNTKFSNVITKTRKYGKNENIIIEILPEIRRHVTVYSSLSFSETVARIGGITNLMILFFTLINYIKNYFQFEYNMVKKYFQKINEDIKIEFHPNKTWIQEEMNKAYNSFINRISTNTKPVKKSFKNYSEELNKCNSIYNKESSNKILNNTNTSKIKMIKSNLNSLNLEYERKKCIHSDAFNEEKEDSSKPNPSREHNDSFNNFTNVSKFKFKDNMHLKNFETSNLNKWEQDDQDDDSLKKNIKLKTLKPIKVKKEQNEQKEPKYVKYDTLPKMIKKINFCE